MITIKRPSNNNRPSRACPVCNKPAAPQFRPFCSKTCADIDLGHWLSESYSLPVEGEDETMEATDISDSRFK